MSEDRVRAKVAEVIELAERKFGITLPSINIAFDVKGRFAGKAGRTTVGGDICIYWVNFNPEMLTYDRIERLLNETVPHEIAHIVCFYTGWDMGHGKSWKRVCIALGGSGNRCISGVGLSRARRVTKRVNYRYRATDGTVVVIGDIRHKRIQNGTVYGLASGGKLDHHCQYEQVR